MRDNTLAPTRTYALILGIEQYKLGSASNLDGPAHDACRFADWLVHRGVPQENIALLLSPLDSNRRCLDEWSGPFKWPATRDDVANALYEWLPHQTGDLLWVFWGGHGMMAAARSRRLFYANTTNENWHHLELDSLLTYLSSDKLNSFQQQICLIDTCANYQIGLPQERLGDGDRFPPGVQVRRCEQFVFFATRAGEVAENLSQEQTGLFSKLVLEELTKEPSTSWPPDMEELAGRVRASFSDLAKAGERKQTPIFVSYRTWDGTEYVFGQSAEQAPLIWNVPFPRKQFFTGRKELLNRLYAQLRTMQTATLGQAISGLGGIGKTQLAVEYAYRHQQEYQTVLWAHAETAEALTTSYTEIARLLQLPQKDAKKQEEIVQGVKDWLSNRQNWLLILDNADEPDVLIPFLPPQVKGHLIVTTRAADLSHLGLGFGHALTVPKFTKQQDVPFLLHRAGLTRVSSQDREYARRIADELDGLPLALNQAGVYLATTGSSLAAYWEIYQQQRASLFNTHDDREYPRSVAATLLLSLGRVEQRNPAAADLLRLCAFLAPDAIPEELLTEGARELGEVLAPIAADAYQLNQAFADLRSYSLLTRDPQTRTFIIHRVLQAVLRDSLTIETKQWMKRVVNAVNAVFPNVEHSTWFLCQRYFPHAQVCAAHVEQQQFTFLEAVQLLDKVGTYLWQRGQYDDAEPFFRQALVIAEKTLGEDDSTLASVVNNLALLQVYQSNYKEAEQFFQRAISIGERTLEPNNLILATRLNNLALLYTNQGRYSEAERLFKRALAAREEAPGLEYSNLTDVLNNLAMLYTYRGKYTEAEALYQRVLTIYKEHLNEDDPDIAATLHNLATLYRDQNKNLEAEVLYLRARMMTEKALGMDAPVLALRLTNLAILYTNQGRYEEAETIFRQAWDIVEKKLQPDHPDHPIIAACRAGLANCYRVQGKFVEETEHLFLQAIASGEKIFVLDHPSLVKWLSNLALFYTQQGRYGEAEQVFLRIIASSERIFDLNHPILISRIDNLASFYTSQGKYEKAEPLYKRVLLIQEHSLGSQHPKTIATRATYTALLQSMGQRDEASPSE